MQPAEIKDPKAPDRTFPKKKREVRFVSSVGERTIKEMTLTISGIPGRQDIKASRDETCFQHWMRKPGLPKD
jgi:hypothetical protein